MGKQFVFNDKRGKAFIGTARMECTLLEKLHSVCEVETR